MNVHFKFFAILSLTALFVAPFLVSAQSSAPDLQALIKQLQAQIQALQQQVQTLQQELGKSPEPTSPAVGSPSNVPSVSSEIPPSLSEATPPELTRSLSRGSSGDDVRKLQEFLARDKDIY
ncbi:MAG: hypothetical protein HYW91_00920, partial [Candidatus Sungbacteria bacterium]|nr:hypothetical protein [Candidatus Sungbacteria bacterium]